MIKTFCSAISQINNANKRGQSFVCVKINSLVLKFLQLLQNYGFIYGFHLNDQTLNLNKKGIIYLKFLKNKAPFLFLNVVSKPSFSYFITKKKLLNLMKKFPQSFAVLNTSNSLKCYSFFDLILLKKKKMNFGTLLLFIHLL